MKKVYILPLVLLTIFNSCNKDKPGCTDPLAKNYNTNAKEDDGSCDYGSSGFINDTSYSFGQLALVTADRFEGNDGDTKVKVRFYFEDFKRWISGGSTLLPASDYDRYGIVYATHDNPTTGDKVIIFSDLQDVESWGVGHDLLASITGLQPNTQYYFNVFAEIDGKDTVGINPIDVYTSKNGIISGSSGGTVTDIEGTVYPTVVFPNGQEWMAADLKTETLNDGTPLKVRSSVDYSNNESSASYATWATGKDTVTMSVYNGHAIITGKLCPTGWKLPTESDYYQFSDLMTTAGLPVDRDEFLAEKTNGTGWSGKPNAGSSNYYYWLEGQKYFSGFSFNAGASSAVSLDKYHAGVRCIKK